MVLLNSVNCGVNRKGTGVLDCIQELGIPAGFITVPTNWFLDTETGTFDMAYVQEQIQAGEFTPFLVATNFTDNSEEDVFETLNSGVQVPVRDGKPLFTYEYNNGYCWHSAAYTHNGFKNRNVILVWDNDVFGFASTAGGTAIKGLTTGYIKTANFMNNDGTVGSKTNISLQLLDPFQYNSEMVLLNSENTDVSADEVRGIVDAMLSVPTVPATTDTTVDVKVVAHCNQAIDILGLTADDFVVTDKTVDTATYNATTGLYELTVTPAFATGETFTVKLNDGTYDAVVTADGLIVAGESPEYTVA